MNEETAAKIHDLLAQAAAITDVAAATLSLAEQHAFLQQKKGAGLGTIEIVKILVKEAEQAKKAAARYRKIRELVE